MTERSRVFVLILIMAVSSTLVVGVTIWMLYNVAFAQERTRLIENAQSQARLIEAVARFDRVYSADEPHGWQAATLRQVNEAHREYEGFGKTGEFTLARQEGGAIVFVLRHRYQTVEHPAPVPFDSEFAEPMRLALLGKSGALIGLDYRGETVLAAYEPVAELNLGIVAKIDLAEVRAPFVRAGLTAIRFMVLVVLVGAFLFIRVGGPLVTALERRSRELEDSMIALRESEDRFRTTFELAGAGIVHNSPGGRFIRINRRFCEISGYDREELLEMSSQDITHPDDLAADLVNVGRALSGEINTYSMEKRYLHKDSTIVWVSLVVTLVRDSSGDPSHFIGVVENITDRKRSERALQSSLAEKEVLLREIHHRVKNNMQVISSLLNLQSRSIDDPRLAKMIEESQNRVRAMALIHEILYASGHLVQIDLQEYVTKLATSLVRMYGNEPGMIELRVATGDIALEIDDSVPCGLVINELISNSLKYAFEDGRAGVIKIEAARANDGQIVLVVSDDGVGIPAEVDIRNTESMGMRLVIGLVENQLGGHVAFDRSHGACFTITFTPNRPGRGR